MTLNKQSVYQRIVDDFKRKIELGLLAEGERLPSCRELAVELGVNPNTVQRAYSELETDGYIYALPKKGVYVSPRKGENLRTRAARDKLTELRNAGFGRDELIALLNEIFGGTK